MEQYVTGTGQVLSVHESGRCLGDTCVIHNPSDHFLSDRPTHWRDDRALMERICPHGIGHPDPDGLLKNEDGSLAAPGQTIHGCDGCCRGIDVGPTKPPTKEIVKVEVYFECMNPSCRVRVFSAFQGQETTYCPACGETGFAK